MTTPPRAPDWYPDPSGKPGHRYWDGRQWLADVPATASPEQPSEQPPEQPLTTSPRAPRQTALIAALFVTVAILFAIIGITSYLLLSRSHQAPAAQPAPASPVPPGQAAAPPAPPPSPTSSATPASQNFTTPSGKICQVTSQQVTCQTCVPASVITVAYTCPDPAPAVAVNTQGIVDHHPPDMASPPGAQQLSAGQTYHVDGWTIVVSGGWARFINDTTGHGMAMAAQNFDSF